MPRRIGKPRGTGGRSTGLLDRILGAVVEETRTKRAPRSAAPRDASVAEPGGGPRIGAIRLGVRRQGEAFEDYSSDLFGGELSNEQAATDLDEVVRRRMAALGLDPVEEAEQVDPQREAGEFARRLAWDLRIAGQHHSGVSNQRLLEYRQAEGRDFAEDTATLRDHVRDAVRQGVGADWDDDRAAQIAATTILAWIVRRIEERGVDVSLAPLSPRYRAFKAKAGLDSRIGIATGRWLAAVRRAEVSVTA